MFKDYLKKLNNMVAPYHKATIKNIVCEMATEDAILESKEAVDKLEQALELMDIVGNSALA